jgi:cellulose synthase/poly-beta-1,6-N-acetylglucosamine synthase-like glycosyltransferase
VGFIGALNWQPNLDGLRWFLAGVWPRVLRSLPDATLHIAGKGANANTKNWITGKNIFFEGEVKDAGRFMGSMTVMISPLFAGSGLRIKIIEAMSLGKTVVATPVAAAGLPVEDHRELLIGTDAVSFCDALTSALSDPGLRATTGAKARELVRNRFDNLKQTSLLLAFYKRFVMAAETIFLITLILLVWTYLLYPALVFKLADIRRKRKPTLLLRHSADTEGTENEEHQQQATSPPPSVSVIMSLFNEEKVISEKIHSLLLSDYPSDLIEFLIGSDASNDGTDEIMKKFAASDDRIKYHHNMVRKGKAAMLNELAVMASGSILIITDANVIFSGGTVRRLVSGFTSSQTGLCDATVIPSTSPGHGLTRQENLYSRFETSLRRAEGEVWKAMSGPYGGCYAVRRELFPVMPENTLVDDLYVGLTVMCKGFASFNIPEAVVSEDTQPGIADQYRRRVRIAAGSFQNLFRFGPFPSGKVNASFVFFSHKILRWFTPLFLSLFFMTTVILSGRSVLYFCLATVQLILILLSAIDLMFDKFGRTIKLPRYVTQFLLMNAALTAGFVKAVRGIKNGIWEPTKRV